MNTEQKTVYDFQSDVKDLLHLMIHSLYSNKEIFLRELISNASDAIDKLRFLSISKPELYENNSNLNIRIFSNKNNNTLTIRDNGIGMNYQDTIDNLGTIAKSGTKKFVQDLQKQKVKNSQLIGQFGVGFYSAFIVSNKVAVRTRLAGEDTHKGVLWESYGTGNYTISNITKKERGTEITLFLKEKEKNFLDYWKIKSIITKYSDHITVPVEIKNTEKKDSEWEKVNTAQALWCLKRNEITDDQYKKFYKSITNDIHEPLLWSHNHVEGKLDYTSLVYIPKKSSWDIWNKDNKHGLKLYIKRVYIMDDAEQFLPNYLRFVRGLIDSNDLPLNISREILQENSLIKHLRTALTKRILQLLENLAKTKQEQYHEFWKEFGLVLKEGPAEDNINRNTILNLLRFSSINTGTSEQTLSLNNYVSNMLTQQEKIYFITADSYSAAHNSPHLEIFKKKGIDVLLLSDKIDEWMMNYVTEFNGKKFQSVNKNDSSIDKILDINNKQEKKIKTEILSFINHAKKVLGDQVKDINVTNTLVSSPAVLVTDSNEMSTQMSKLFLAAGQKAPKIKYILKINPEHQLIKKIISITDDKETTKWIKLLMEQALLIEQGHLNNPNSFIKRINELLLQNNI